MSKPGRVVRWERVMGAPVTRNGITVTPQWSALTVSLPSFWFTWRRPVAVFIEQEQRVERKPIFDMVRVLELGLIAMALVVGIVAQLITEKRKA